MAIGVSKSVSINAARLSDFRNNVDYELYNAKEKGSDALVIP
jgi:hypothetical protein